MLALINCKSVENDGHCVPLETAALVFGGDALVSLEKELPAQLIHKTLS